MRSNLGLPTPRSTHLTVFVFAGASATLISCFIHLGIGAAKGICNFPALSFVSINFRSIELKYLLRLILVDSEVFVHHAKHH